MIRRLITLGSVSLALTLPADTHAQQRSVVEGVVYDTVAGSVIPLAVVRLAGTMVSTLTNDRGYYRLVLPVGQIRLEVRRIGYSPASVILAISEYQTRYDIYLRPVAVELAPIIVVAEEDEAHRIIKAAIARKHALFAATHDYRYDAYVKFVVRDLEKPQDSAASVVLISETRTTAYWEQPNHYQETILARRQSSNLDAERNLLSVGQIVNFNRERIDLRRYSLVSPIADDALEHYDYRVLDTLSLDDRRVFRLGLQPKYDASPLFIGVIDIADSTYDVTGVDVGVNRAARFNLLKNIRYQQHLRDMGGGRWMPDEIKLTGEVRFRIPLPGFPHQLAFEHIASLNDYRFDRGDRPRDLSEVRIVVSDRADRPDSATWSSPEAIPLSAGERAAWARIDSIERAPQTFGAWALGGVRAGARLATNPDFFHFNRVDGPYLGVGDTYRGVPGLTLRGKLGYGSGSELWQYRLGGQVRLVESQRLWVGFAYHSETVPRNTLVSRSYDPTFRALFFRVDPLDYYRDQGATVSLSTKLADFTHLDVEYNDLHQSSLPVVTSYSVFHARRAVRPNVPIDDGRMRSFSGRLTYDSRAMVRREAQDSYLQSPTWTRVTLSAEVASPTLVANDFDFGKYSLQIERRQRTFNLGMTTFSATVGASSGTLPKQRYFTIDPGKGVLTFQGGGFNTVRDSSFIGNRVAMFTVRHEFDRLLFAKSRLPLIRKLPFTLSVHGGLFWTDFSGQAVSLADSFKTAPGAYREIGFGLGNLTPFLSPFNLAAHLTWQVSSYQTRRFRFGLSFGQF